ncbi:MAG: tetratricopeptide repeat protein [Magnetovibrionaceae bacterium]
MDSSQAIDGLEKSALDWVRTGDYQAAAGKWAEAEKAYRAAIRLAGAAVGAPSPVHAAALGGLGSVLLATGRHADAAYTLSQAIKGLPREPNFRINLASTFLQMGRPDLAADQADAAVQLAPRRAEAWYLLGEARAKQGAYKASIVAQTRQLELKPDFPPALINRAFCFFRLGQLDAAGEDLDRALSLDPNLPQALLNKARLQHMRGDHAGAIHMFAACIEQNPADAVAHAELIVALDYLQSADLETQSEERRSWNHWHAAPLKAQADRRVYDLVADPERRLTIGVLSKDLFGHSSAFLYAPLFLNMDPDRFRLIAFDAGESHDTVTEQFAARSDAWIDVTGLDVEDIAERIFAERVDILVDISGFLTPKFLLVHARKPAPVSVCGWGHATGSGMEAMDGFVVDPHLVPEASRVRFSETLLDLPCALPYWAPEDAPDPSPPPAETKGFVTFGCFNRVNKINDAVLDCWSDILARLPESRLLLKDLSLHEASMQIPLIEGFEARGVDLDRIEIEGRSDRRSHLAAFSRVDVALDPFPQAGGTSTWEALWQGVPVISLALDTPASRNGASILNAIGLGDLVAETPEQYVGLALDLAEDWQRRAVLRARLRSRIRTSPAGDLEGYGRALEGAFRGLWRRWCSSRFKTT